MTQIENGEGGLSVRNKLNTALTQLDAVSATTDALSETTDALTAAQPYATRAAFIAATVPDDTKRTAFIVNGQTYAVVRDAAGPITQTNGQRWRPDGDITPQHFGAVGNGVADDTAAIQAAINVATSFPQAELFVPQGDYLVTATLTVGNTGRLYMYGAGKALTRFVFTATNSPGIEWTVNGTYSKLSKFRMTGPGRVLGNTAVGIKSFQGAGSSSIFMLFEDLWLQRWPMWAIELSDSYNCKLVDSLILQNGVRSTLAGLGADGQGGGVLLKRVNFTGAASTGNDWTNCYFKENNIGVQVQPGGSDQKILNTRFDMCIFEFNYIGMDLRNTGTGSKSRFVFLNTCYIENNLFAGVLGDDGSQMACWQNLTTPGTGTPPSVSVDGADGIVWFGRFVRDSPGNFTIGNNTASEPSKREIFRVQKVETDPRIDRIIVQRETGIVLSSLLSRPVSDEVRILSGSGSPEGVVAAIEGSIYLRRGGGTGTCLYIKESGGTGNTGWVAK